MFMIRRKGGKMQKREKSCINGGDRKKRVKREYIERGSKSVVKRGKECIKRRNYGKGIKMFLCK